jgi:hypothetical protein
VNVEKLAEAIILQSVEDLWDERYREDCINFFSGEEVSIYAGMGGMNVPDQIKLLNMVNGLIKNLKKPAESLRISKAIENRHSQRHVISGRKHHTYYYH